MWLEPVDGLQVFADLRDTYPSRNTGRSCWHCGPYSHMPMTHSGYRLFSPSLPRRCGREKQPF
jgi:hypothetical protein